MLYSEPSISQALIPELVNGSSMAENWFPRVHPQPQHMKGYCKREIQSSEWQSIAVNYTSGTTSAPKGVVHSHRGIYTMVMDALLTWGMKSQPIYLWTQPAAVLLKIEELGFSVMHSYGLTETRGLVVTCAWKREWDKLPADERAKLKARQGVRGFGLAELDVKDSGSMDRVARDGVKMGEVMMRAPSIMKGYLKDKRSTRKAMEGGWLHTGDMGVIHPDCYMDIKDRSKDVIISGAENISSMEVDSVLYSHPMIVEADIVASPDPFWGETPCAFVSTNSAVRGVTEANIISFCRERLPHYMVPKTMAFIESLPKTSTGKIQKYVLREMAKKLSQPEHTSNKMGSSLSRL